MNCKFRPAMDAQLTWQTLTNLVLPDNPTLIPDPTANQCANSLLSGSAKAVPVEDPVAEGLGRRRCVQGCGERLSRRQAQTDRAAASRVSSMYHGSLASFGPSAIIRQICSRVIKPNTAPVVAI